jgi:hypothetical protein
MKKFNITFTENKKYNPATRTIMVEQDNEELAKRLVHTVHGGFDKNGNPNNKIVITKVKEVKEKKNKKEKVS